MTYRFERNSQQALFQIRRNTTEAVAKSGIDAQRELKRTLSQGTKGTPSSPGQPPTAQTGTGRRSVQIDNSRLFGTDTPRTRVGTNLPYMGHHEFGGTITAKKGALAVPIGAEGRKAATQAGGNIRSLKLTFIPRKGRAPLLVRENVKRGSVHSFTPLFILLKSVTTKPRPWLRPTMARSDVREKITRNFSPAKLLKGVA